VRSPELNDFLSEIAFALRAETAALLVQQLPVQRGRQRAPGCEHFVEGCNAITRSRQKQKQAHARIAAILQLREVEGARLHETGDAEQNAVVRVVSVKDAELPVAKTRISERKHQSLSRKTLPFAGHEPDGYDAFGAYRFEPGPGAQRGRLLWNRDVSRSETSAPVARSTRPFSTEAISVAATEKENGCQHHQTGQQQKPSKFGHRRTRA
jgi:hypothetical protein